MRLYRSTQHAELISPLSSVHPERAQAGAFLPKLLEQAGLVLKEDAKVSAETVGEDAEKAEESRKKAVMQRYATMNEAILELNVVLGYKKVVQWRIYSPPDCDKYLALDAKPQVSVALALTLWPRLWHSAISQGHDTRALHTPDLQLRTCHSCVGHLVLGNTLLLHTRRPTRRTLSAC